MLTITGDGVIWIMDGIFMDLDGTAGVWVDSIDLGDITVGIVGDGVVILATQDIMAMLDTMVTVDIMETITLTTTIIIIHTTTTTAIEATPMLMDVEVITDQQLTLLLP